MENTVESNVRRWLDSPAVSDADKDAIRAMSPAVLDASFFKNIEFGTGGMRGILGPGTNCMNVFTVGRATIGFGQSR